MEAPEYHGFGPRFDNSDYSTDTITRRTMSFVFKSEVEQGKNTNTLESKIFSTCDRAPATQTWVADLYGIPRIGVHGIDTVCVAVRKEDVLSLRRHVRQGQVDDPARLMFSDAQYRSEEECWNMYFHKAFMMAVLFEVEELGLESSERVKDVRRPFFLVTSMDGHETKVENKDGDTGFKSAAEFLCEEVKGKKSFTFTETLKTAVAALQVLLARSLRKMRLRYIT